MFASIRRYIVASGHEADAIAHARSGFLPLLQREPGFIAYYFVNLEDGEFMGVSIFDSKEGAAKANTIAAVYVNEHLTDIMSRTMLVDGEVEACAFTPQAITS